MNNQLVHKILERLEHCLQVDSMHMMSIRDPYDYKKIIYIVEGELYKHKRKLYPKSINNLGEGYSQFFEDKTRISILKQVKDIILSKKGLSGERLMDSSERLLEIIDDSIKHLKRNYKESAPVKPKQIKNSGESSPIIKTAKMIKDEAIAQEKEKIRMKNQLNDPFRHNPKLKGVHEMIQKIQFNNDKRAQSQIKIKVNSPTAVDKEQKKKKTKKSKASPLGSESRSRTVTNSKSQDTA